MFSDRLKTAARLLLLRHDNLRNVQALEPDKDPETGMPLDAEAWLEWYEGRCDPAYQVFEGALATFREAYGGRIGGHPRTFRPVCHAILAERPGDVPLAQQLVESNGELVWGPDDEPDAPQPDNEPGTRARVDLNLP